MILNIFLILLGLTFFNVSLLILSCNKDVKSVKDENQIFIHPVKQKKSSPQNLAPSSKKIKAKTVANLPKESQLAATRS